jgi:hypothetical protein
MSDEIIFDKDAAERGIERACRKVLSEFVMERGSRMHFEHKQHRDTRISVDVRFRYRGFTGNSLTSHAPTAIKSVTISTNYGYKIRPLVLTAVHKQDNPGKYVAAKLAEFAVKVIAAMDAEHTHERAHAEYLSQVHTARELVLNLCGGFGVVPTIGRESRRDPSRYRATFGNMTTSGKVQEPDLNRYTLAFENLTLAQLEHLFATAARMAKQDPDGTNEPSK